MEDRRYMIGASELQVIRQELGNEGLDSTVQRIQGHFNQLDKTELNIAVTGGSGKGEIHLYQRHPGPGDEDEGSAPTGEVETTMGHMPYRHPNYPNVTLWDLPGIGTENFRADEYLEKVEFHQYDFFIIISSERFSSNDAKLAREIHKMGKHFYFIRSKIDNDVKAAARKKSYNKKATLDKIRQDCITGLQEVSIESPKVFLISSYELQRYDFPQLQETLVKELPKEKRHRFLHNITHSIIQQKKEVLKADIWKVAMLSATVAMVPIPGLSFAADVAILVKEICRYYIAFGLDEVSLKSLSQHVNVPVEELKKSMKSDYPDCSTVGSDMVMKMLTKAAGRRLMNVRLIVRFIPTLGSVAAGGIAFGTTYSMLQTMLDELAKNAHRMMKRAFSDVV